MKLRRSTCFHRLRNLKKIFFAAALKQFFHFLLQIQLLVTLGFVCLMVLHGPTREFAHRNSQLMIIPMVGTLVLVCVIACCENVRRQSPLNVILLGAFTLMESLLVGFISSTYNPKIVSLKKIIKIYEFKRSFPKVLLAVGLTAAIVVGLTIFAFQTRFDFTVCGGVLCIVLMVFGLGSIIGALFFRSDFLHFLFACFGAGLFSIYIVYDTQMMMGNNLLRLVDHKSAQHFFCIFRRWPQIFDFSWGICFRGFESLHGYYSAVLIFTSHSQIFE